MSFPATVSVDNRGSVLPDALNTGDAVERYGQVSQKVMVFGWAYCILWFECICELAIETEAII
jgi:hypothetical protein